MELIYKKDAIHAVLHNEGQAAVAAVENIEAVDAVPMDFIGAVHTEYVEKSKQGGRVGAMYALYANALEFLCNRWDCNRVIEGEWGKENTDAID